MINTSSTLSPDLFGDGDPFTIDFWYKPLVVINACSVGHEWYNGIFYFGIAGDAGDLGLFLLLKEEQMEVKHLMLLLVGGII